LVFSFTFLNTTKRNLTNFLEENGKKYFFVIITFPKYIVCLVFLLFQETNVTYQRSYKIFPIFQEKLFNPKDHSTLFRIRAAGVAQLVEKS
jgi:hypothetical protein